MTNKAKQPDHVQDIEFLIRQLETLEHLQDDVRIGEIAKKYGIKRGWE